MRSTVVESLRAALAEPRQLLTSSLDVHRYASDASHFALVPQAVAVAADATDVQRLMRACAATGLPLTFRSGGTSLSGQAVTDALLVDTRQGFRRTEVLDDGARVRVQPGVTVRQLNARLAPHGRKFGPDPASESACTIGGVIANNSSGMACGTIDNAYRTLVSATVVLASGTTLDTGTPSADDTLRAAEPDLFRGLSLLRDRLRDDSTATDEIRRQFAMKNSMGYALNAFVDHDRVADILAHLMVGSEGTLGFVAEAVFRTVPLLPEAATALLLFPDLSAANQAITPLADSGATMIELLDATSLRVAQAANVPTPSIADVDIDTQAALLVEYHATGREELDAIVADGHAVFATLPVAPAELTTDAATRRSLWRMRKDLYALVASSRRPGTTALLEDIAVPVPALADACADLTGLFAEHGYPDSVVFGHAKDGNLHFMLADRFESPESLGRFSRFTEAMVDLVLGHRGTLKAEHGAGRMMAPFVRRQFGDTLYGAMVDVKELLDPAGILNPGVIVNDDPHAHLVNIKAVEPVDAEVDRCVECGYCEPVCPSKDLTTTPRQRIVLRRAMAAAAAAGDDALLADLTADYDYAAVQTCAADGMCETACPVLINTGELVKRLRAEGTGRPAQAAGRWAAGHWAGTTRVLSAGLNAAKATPPIAAAATRAARAVVGEEAVPAWSRDLPRGGARRRRPATPDRPDAVYFPTCVNSLFGAGQQVGVQDAVERLAARAGLALVVPDDIDGLCCSTPWTSKGLVSGADRMSAKTLASVAAEAGARDLVVVSDASSCTETLTRVMAAAPGARVVDAVAWVLADVIDHLDVEPLETIVVHPTCASVRSGDDRALLDLASRLAHHVVVPPSWGCCGFAGDRGLLHPELTASATRAQAAEVVAVDADAHVSSNRPCELAMSRATGRRYTHILQVLEAQSRPRTGGRGPTGPRG